MELNKFVKLLSLRTVTASEVSRTRRAARTATVYRREILLKLRYLERDYALQGQAIRARALVAKEGITRISRNHYRHGSVSYTLQEICVKLELHRML